jgi:hypothetical protein
MGVHATRRAHRALLGSALCLAALLSGCSGDKSSAEPSPAPSTLAATEPSSEATSASLSWEQQFTSSQLAAYEAAKAQLEAYESESEPYWASGKATPEAKKLFQKYFPAPVWQIYFDRLKTYEQADVTVTGLPTVVWSKATNVDATARQGSVTLLQCVDYSTQVVEQAGKSIDPIPGSVLRRATLDEGGTGGWLVLRIDEPSIEKYEACPKELQ